MPAGHGLVSSGDYTRLRRGPIGRRVGRRALHSAPRVGLMRPAGPAELIPGSMNGEIADAANAPEIHERLGNGPNPALLMILAQTRLHAR
jgi:hypothetical protein